VTDFLDQKVQEIRARLRELEPLLDEYDRLRAALDALDAVGTGAEAGDAEQPRRGGRGGDGGGGAGGGRRGRRRTGEPTRADRLVELARERPGITIAEAAREMDVVPNGLYQVVAKLTREGELRKQGPGLFPVAREGEAPATAEEQATGEEPATGDERTTAEEQAADERTTAEEPAADERTTAEEQAADEPATAERPEREQDGVGEGHGGDPAPGSGGSAPADEAA
jgi:transposase-like protein